MKASFRSVLGCIADAARPCVSKLKQCVPADVSGAGRLPREWLSYEHTNQASPSLSSCLSADWHGRWSIHRFTTYHNPNASHCLTLTQMSQSTSRGVCADTHMEHVAMLPGRCPTLCRPTHCWLGGRGVVMHRQKSRLCLVLQVSLPCP